MVESVVLSDRSRALLRCIVAAFDASAEDGAPGAAPVLVPGDDLGPHAAWPCDVAPPTRDELTPLRMQGLVTVAAAGEDRLTVSPTALGREAAGLLAPAAVAPDAAPVSRRLVERVAELVEAESDAETRLRFDQMKAKAAAAGVQLVADFADWPTFIKALDGGIGPSIGGHLTNPRLHGFADFFLADRGR